MNIFYFFHFIGGIVGAIFVYFLTISSTTKPKLSPKMLKAIKLGKILVKSTIIILIIVMIAVFYFVYPNFSGPTDYMLNSFFLGGIGHLVLYLSVYNFIINTENNLRSNEIKEEKVGKT